MKKVIRNVVEWIRWNDAFDWMCYSIIFLMGLLMVGLVVLVVLVICGVIPVESCDSDTTALNMWTVIYNTQRIMNH